MYTNIYDKDNKIGLLNLPTYLQFLVLFIPSCRPNLSSATIFQLPKAFCFYCRAARNILSICVPENVSGQQTDLLALVSSSVKWEQW